MLWIADRSHVMNLDNMSNGPIDTLLFDDWTLSFNSGDAVVGVGRR